MSKQIAAADCSAAIATTTVREETTAADTGVRGREHFVPSQGGAGVIAEEPSPRFKRRAGIRIELSAEKAAARLLIEQLSRSAQPGPLVKEIAASRHLCSGRTGSTGVLNELGGLPNGHPVVEALSPYEGIGTDSAGFQQLDNLGRGIGPLLIIVYHDVPDGPAIGALMSGIVKNSGFDITLIIHNRLLGNGWLELRSGCMGRLSDITSDKDGFTAFLATDFEDLSFDLFICN